MISGECPYEDCDEPIFIPCADKCPAFQKIICEKCKRVFWEKHSRINPEGFTEEDFYKKYEVNEETREIKERAADTKEVA